MRKTFRAIALLIVAALMVVAFAPAANAQSEPIQLTLQGWSSSTAENVRLQEIVDNWNAANPGIQVTLDQVPDYDTTLARGLASANPPDIFYVDSFRFLDLVQAGALLAVDERIEGADDFYPSLRAAFTFNDQFYCPPKDFSTLALQINTQMFEAAGLEPPTTWEELRAAAEALTTDEVAGIVVPADFARWIAFLYQAGGSVTDDEFTQMTINSPEALEALDFYTGLVLDGVGQTPASLGAGWPGEAFGQGKAAMAFEGNWIVPYLNDNFPDLDFVSVELPAGPAGRATMAFTVCYAIPASGQTPEEQEAAIEFLNYLVSVEGMQAWTDLGLAMPTRMSLADRYVEMFPELQAHIAGGEYARKWQFVPGFGQVLDAVNQQLSLLFLGDQLPEDALVEIENVGNAVLAQR